MEGKVGKSNLIGFLLVVVGLILTAVGVPVYISAPIMGIGVFLFVSFPDEDVFVDYFLADTDDVILRQRHYILFLPFTIVTSMLTLGKGELKIAWKTEYYKAKTDGGKILEKTQLTRKEYIAIRNEQRVIYATKPMSKAYMTSHYSEEFIALPRKKKRLIAAIVFSVIFLSMVTEPTVGIWLTLIYESFSLPMVFLWIPDYKDAKILQHAYDNAVDNTTV